MRQRPYPALMLYLAFLSAVLLAACDRAPQSQSDPTAAIPLESQPETMAPLTAGDEAAIYAAAIEALFRRRGDSIGGVDAPVVYLNRRVQGGGGLDSEATPASARLLDSASQQRIEAALADFPARVAWADGYDGVPFVQELFPGADNGALISLSHIGRRADGAALVSAGLSFNCNCEIGGGSYLVVEKQEGRWRVTRTEAEWEY
jgi:hypothetical protein